MNDTLQDEKLPRREHRQRECAEFHRKRHRYHPSSKGEACEVCGSALTIRADDAPDVVRSRLEVYHSTTEPLKEYYLKKGNLVLVMGAEDVEETTKRTLTSLGI